MQIMHRFVSRSLAQSPQSPGRTQSFLAFLALVAAAGLVMAGCGGAGSGGISGGGSETPAPPVVSLGQASHENVTISWTAPDTDLAVSGYQVRWRLETDSNFVDSAEVASTETTYTIVGLQPGTTYEIQVGAVFPAEVAWSRLLTATTVSEATPIADATPGISVESSQPTSITVTLMPPQEGVGFVGYELRWRTTAETEFSPPVQIPMSQTSYTISGLVAGTDYVIEVRAVDTEGDGDWARLEAATTPASGTDGTGGTTNGQDPMDQRLPPDVSIGMRERMSLTVTWSPPATTLAVSKYVLHWQKLGATSWDEVDNIGATETSHTILGLDQDTTYLVRMKTVFMDNSESEWSNALRVATLGDVPEISIAAVSDQYPESADQVRFRLTLTPVTSEAITVQVTVDEQGANRLDPRRPLTEVSVGSGKGFETFAVGLRPTHDPALQPNSTITVTLRDGQGYKIVSPASASTRVVDAP